MVRPREFDEAEVLERALETFWLKGFDGTSIKDIVESTGLARASLYGAFGDKQQLYERVLEHYASRQVQSVVALGDDAPLRDVLGQLLTGWIGLSCSKTGPRGCFLVLAGTQGNDTPFAREALAASLRRMEKQLSSVIRRGQARAELAPDRDPASLARLLVVLSQGIATSARAGWGQDRLRSVVQEMLDLAVPK